METNSIIEELNINGWCLIERKTDDNELIKLGNSIGKIIPDDNGKLIQKIIPKQKNNGIKGSFSYNYGLNSFPYHTDTAFWSIPARYIIMSSAFQSNCKTYVLNINKITHHLNIEMLEKAIFISRTFTSQKFTSLIINHSGDKGFRYDTNTMIPFNISAKKIIDSIDKAIQSLSPIEIEWNGNNILILDNWKVLHSRGNLIEEENRILKRIYLQKN